MCYIGAHMSTGKGFDKAAEVARSIGATAMQVFTRNPRGGSARALKERELERLAGFREAGLAVVCHSPYTVNLASGREDVRQFGIETVTADLVRMQALGADGLVVHSGAHIGAGEAAGLARLCESLEVILPAVPAGSRILLETMSGSGSELGSRLEGLAEVWAHFGRTPALGLCLDTCHLFAAGYDVRDWAAFKTAFMAHLPWQIVGCIHMNDSKTPFASHKDRHERLGEGMIGWPAFETIVRAEAASGIPLIMETPNGLDGWAAEIARLRAVLDEESGQPAL